MHAQINKQSIKCKQDETKETIKLEQEFEIEHTHTHIMSVAADTHKQSNNNSTTTPMNVNRIESNRMEMN